MTENLLMIVSFAVIFLISLFVFWQAMTSGKKHEGINYKNGRPLLPEHIFDFWFITGILSLLFSRAFYVLSNFSEYRGLEWSVTPWLRISETKTEWFTKFPWLFLNFVAGMDLAVFLLAFFLVFLLITWLVGLEIRKFLASFKSGIFSMIVSLELYYLLLGTLGIGQGSTFDIKVNELLSGDIYFLLIVILTIGFLLLDNFYLKGNRVEADLRKLKLTFLVFSGYFSAVYLLIRLEQNYENLLLYLALLPILVGVFMYFFYARNTRGMDVPELSDKPAAALKIDFLKTKKKKKK